MSNVDLFLTVIAWPVFVVSVFTVLIHFVMYLYYLDKDDENDKIWQELDGTHLDFMFRFSIKAIVSGVWLYIIYLHPLY